jgi:hypothetical protein
VKKILVLSLLTSGCNLFCQETVTANPSQTQTQLKVNQLVEKKAEYHRLTNGVQDGYRIKIHLSVDRDAAETIKTKCLTKFTDVPVHLEYQQPNWVVLVGDYKTKLEAFDSLRKIQAEFPSAFIVKAIIDVK